MVGKKRGERKRERKKRTVNIPLTNPPPPLPTKQNIGSIDALRVPALENYAYSASKAGLHHLSRTMALALGPRGVTVNTLACGPFPSKMMRAVLDAAGAELAEANPVGRIGTPEDVAGACLFLCGRSG